LLQDARVSIEQKHTSLTYLLCKKYQGIIKGSRLNVSLFFPREKSPGSVLGAFEVYNEKLIS
jgi:hypothetical protein